MKVERIGPSWLIVAEVACSFPPVRATGPGTGRAAVAPIYWTGTAWSDNLDDARVYAVEQDATGELERHRVAMRRALLEF